MNRGGIIPQVRGEDIVTTKLDDKGRISIPADIRERLGLESGDVMFLDVQDMVLRVAKATNPFDALIDEAINEFEAGKTTSLSDFAEDEGVEFHQ